ncbi:MAG: response regulator transcription factor [Acidobacteriota bacterium]
MAGRILVIEDDQSIADLIKLYLDKQGYTVFIFNNGPSALEKWDDIKPDLALLDLMLPGMDGWEICQQIRKIEDVPIIVVTAKGALPDKLHGFDLGIDDYVVKPFDPLELLARIGAVLRRRGRDVPDNEQKVVFPGLVVDLATFSVTVKEQPVDLTRREAQLLFFLASHPEKVFTREYLLQEIWGYDYPGGTRTVDVHINRLRDKVEDESHAWHIRTVWGVGYKFEVK